MSLELYITNDTGTYLADIDDNVKIITERLVTAFRNPASGTGSYTYNFKLPLTSANRKIFNHADNTQVLGKFNNVYEAVIMYNGVRIIKGEFELKSISKGFTGNVTGILATKISDLISDTKNLRGITSFTPLDFKGVDTVADYMNRKSLAYYPADSAATDKSEIAFAYTIDSFNTITDYDVQIGYEDIGISHFTGAIFENIFKDVGYKVTGNILNTEIYKKMLLLYSNSDGVFQKWNYGALNTFKAVAYNADKVVFSNSNISTTITRDSDVIYVIQPSFQSYQGDLSNSLGNDGVYTCKSSGLYYLEMASPMSCDILGANNGPYINFKYFYCFRCISNDEFLKSSQLAPRTTFDNAGASAYITDLDTFYTGEGAFTVNMIEGQQYAVQVYVSIPKSFTGKLAIYSDISKVNYLNCNKHDSKLLVNPADFLPDMTCKKFIEDFFRLHNLYYTINTDSKTINLFTRDEFFLSTITDTIDITDKIVYDELEETPITTTDINANYYKWKSDGADYILSNTDYMNLVNGEVNDSYELSFAPLGFIRKEYLVYPKLPNYSVTKMVSDFFPAIIPYSESNDQRLLTDKEAENNNAYAPRICYYHGNVFTDDYVAKQLSYMHMVPLKGYSNYYDSRRVIMPRLSFFDLVNQPAYEVLLNSTRRDFSLINKLIPNIFANNEPIIKPMLQVKSLDVISPNSSFKYNYKEVIQLNKFSNYITTSIRMNSILFDKMNGRYLLKISNLTYLLDSVTEYDMENETAKIKIYRNI